MTRKDYILIAAALKSARVSNSIGDPNKALYNNGIDNAVAMLARALKDGSGFDLNGNRRFDTDRFLAACGVKS